MRKVFCLFFILASVISCTQKKSDYKKVPFCIIDTLQIEEKYFGEYCFLREHSNYPLIKGDGDWTLINTLIKDSVEKFIEQSKLETECLKEDYAPAYLGWANTHFEVLNNNSEVLSIALYLTSGFGGGNMWIPSVKVININPNNRLLLDNKSLLSENITLKYVNETIYKYFCRQFPKDAKETIGLQFIENNNKIENLQYGIKNDSLVVLIPAYPGGHFTYTIYSIPLKKIK